MDIITILSDTTPRYHNSLDEALERHYTECGYLWRAIDETTKPYASGILPAHLLSKYELYMVDGRKPTEDDADKASKACLNAQELEDEMDNSSNRLPEDV